MYCTYFKDGSYVGSYTIIDFNKVYVYWTKYDTGGKEECRFFGTRDQFLAYMTDEETKILIKMSGKVIGQVETWEPSVKAYPKVKTLGESVDIKDNLCPRCGEPLVEKDSEGFFGDTFKVLKCSKPDCGFCK